MSWPYWLGAAVIAALLWLAFRRKEVADAVEEFDDLKEAWEYIDVQDYRGYSCWLERIKTDHPYRWQVRCYRRKERQG